MYKGLVLLIKNFSPVSVQYLNLDLYGIQRNAEIQLPVFLITADLKCRKLMNTLTYMGCDGCSCAPDFCDPALAFVGFDDRPNELYGFYFEVLDRECDKVSYENDTPIREAYNIYNELFLKRRN
jgi:hypothetical protein